MGNVWSELEKTAEAKGGKVTLTENAARRAATAVNEMIVRINSVRKYVDQVDSITGFGHLNSGTQLAAKFSGAGVDLGKRLTGHVKILTDLGDTFIAAANAYEKTEAGSANDIKKTTPNKYTAPKASKKTKIGSPPAKGKYKPQNWGKLPASLRKLDASQRDRSPIDMETASSISYADYLKLGRTIQPQKVLDAAGVWKWIATQLDDEFDDLNHIMKVIASERSWGGEGGSSARQALALYGKKNQEMVKMMKLVGANLEFCSIFLDKMKDAMVEAPAGTKGDKRVAAGHLTAFNTHYKPNMLAASNYVPRIPTTTSPVKAVPDVGKPSDGETTTKTNPDGSKTTTNPDGSKTTTLPDGTKTTTLPDGTQVTQKPDGSTTVKSPDGTTTTLPKGDTAGSTGSTTGTGSTAGTNPLEGLTTLAQLAGAGMQLLAGGGQIVGAGVNAVSQHLAAHPEQNPFAPKGAGGGGGAPPPEGPKDPPKGESQAGKLFPRAQAQAGAPTTGVPAAWGGQAAPATGGVPPTPGQAVGPAGHEKEHKRIEYRTNAEPLDAAFGDEASEPSYTGVVDHAKR